MNSELGTELQTALQLPSDLPSGSELVAEGRLRGAQIDVVPSAFSKLYGVRSEAQFKASRAKTGEATMSMIMGLASLEEQIEGLRYLHALGQESGYVIHRGNVIPDWTTALPPEMRGQAPKGTSFVLGGLEDHIRIAQAAPISPGFMDWHIGCPYCLENTVAAVAAGGSYHGVFAQFVWDMPGIKDHVATLMDNVRAVGIIASRRDEWLVVDTYLDDGMPSHFVDNVSLIGYALLEKYVVDDLCGARYAASFGQLTSDIPTKVAVWLALDEVLKAEHPGLDFIQADTLSHSDTHLVQNFGLAVEWAIFAAVERRFHTGITFMPIPITEKVQVPTKESIGEAVMVAGMATRHAADLERLLDWQYVGAQRDLLVEKGRQFFDNILAVLHEGRVDIRDPLQVLLAVRQIGAHRLESLCHPGERDAKRPSGIIPFVPTELLHIADQMVEAELATIRAKGLQAVVKGRRFLVASADTHWYGAYALRTALEALGAIVIDAGGERDPEDLVKLACENASAALAVSTHNGQCLSYGERLTALVQREGLPCRVFIGGKLNAIVEGDSEPTDMCSNLRAIGVVPCVSIASLVEEYARTA